MGCDLSVAFDGVWSAMWSLRSVIVFTAEPFPAHNRPQKVHSKGVSQMIFLWKVGGPSLKIELTCIRSSDACFVTRPSRLTFFSSFFFLLKTRVYRQEFIKKP